MHLARTVAYLVAVDIVVASGVAQGALVVQQVVVAAADAFGFAKWATVAHLRVPVFAVAYPFAVQRFEPVAQVLVSQLFRELA